MIASLNGILAEKRLDEVTLDVQGVGYRVFISLTAQASLPPEGEPLRLRVRTIVREDAIDLYGFPTAIEEELFLLLTSVSKVGPKVALNVLSGLAPDDLAHAIARGEVGRLTKLHGVGQKTAERIVLELKDKVSPLLKAPLGTGARAASITRSPGGQSDLVSALINLGYKAALAERLAAQAEEALGADAGIDQLIKEALKLARG